jgi:hypothetical protein
VIVHRTTAGFSGESGQPPLRRTGGHGTPAHGSNPSNPSAFLLAAPRMPVGSHQQAGAAHEVVSEEPGRDATSSCVSLRQAAGESPPGASGMPALPTWRRSPDRSPLPQRV